MCFRLDVEFNNHRTFSAQVRTFKYLKCVDLFVCLFVYLFVCFHFRY